LYGILSLFIVVGGFNINPQIEENSLSIERNQMTIMQNLKQNSKEIKEAMKIPVLYRTLCFFILSGLFVPDFQNINYYFVLNVVKLSKFTVSMISIIGYFS
jgi:hypothetical protein